MTSTRFRAVPLLFLAAACGGHGVQDPATGVAPPAGEGAARSSSARAKPNIVLIVADDLDAASVELMPKMQAFLAGQGVTFRNAFATSPICCPSRASMLSGQYAHNHGIWSNGRASVSCFETFRSGGGESNTIATWLKAAGYRTGLIGKYLNRYPGLRPDADESYVPPGWDEWVSVFAQDRTSDAYYEYFLNENRQIASYGKTEADYITDVLFEKALAFVRKGRGEPFFLWLAPNAPHAPAIAANRHRYAYADRRAPRSPSFNEEDISDKPSWYQGLERLTAEEVSDLDGFYRGRIETMLAVDDGIEKLVTTLASLGQLDNTYIVFTSDNGFLLGQHRFPRGKAAPYEESIRIPLVVRGPGVAPGATLSQDALNIDLAPTFADLAQATAPAAVDGRSLMPLLSGNAAPAWRQDFLAEHELDDSDGLPSWSAVRTPAFKYVDYPALAEQEYYDLVEDPFEMSSRSRGLDPSRREQFRARLRQLQECRGASCRN